MTSPTGRLSGIAVAKAAVWAVSVFIGALACGSDRVVDPRVAPTSAIANVETAQQLPAVHAGDSAAVDSLARAVALTLSDANLRQQVHDDFRDSPFSRHRIHLASYLHGSRGRRFFTALSERSGYPAARLSEIAALRGGLEISVPTAVDRMWWKSEQRVAVEGSILTLAERAQIEKSQGDGPAISSGAAYTAEGTKLARSIFTASSYPVIMIAPATMSFGSDPEAVRASAPHANRSTVSSFDEEIDIYKQRGAAEVAAHPDSARRSPSASFLIQCPPEGCGGDVGGGTTRPMGVSLPSGKTYATCYRPGATDMVDNDRDGVDDGCEAELAVAFQPQLVFDWGDCETRREPQFAARQRNTVNWGGEIEIFYALSYTYDCGPESHYGDTEWIIVEVGPSTVSTYRPWSLKYATLSAHWGAPADGTAGYAAQDLEDAIGSPGFGAPRVWVSKGKHSNYRTQSVCDSGAFLTDSCDYPRNLNTDFVKPTYETPWIPFGAGENLGAGYYPSSQLKGSQSTPVYDLIYSSGRYEYYWVNTTFCGWQQPPPPVPGITWCSDTYYKSLFPYGF